MGGVLTRDDGDELMRRPGIPGRRPGPPGSQRWSPSPALAGESNESYGYATLGRLFAVGYITGLRDATYGRPPARYGRQVGEDALR